MDPHFSEYLAAIAGMHDIYGEAPDDRPTEFHEVSEPIAIGQMAPTAVATTPSSGIDWRGEPSEEFAGSVTWTI
jgi:hypothetical protein